MMRENHGEEALIGRSLKDKETIMKLVHSNEAQALVTMLQQQGSVKEAAEAAAAGNTGQLMDMMNRLMKTKEGAQLVETIQNQVKQAGLK